MRDRIFAFLVSIMMPVCTFACGSDDSGDGSGGASSGGGGTGGAGTGGATSGGASSGGTAGSSTGGVAGSGGSGTGGAAGSGGSGTGGSGTGGSGTGGAGTGGSGTGGAGTGGSGTGGAGTGGASAQWGCIQQASNCNCVDTGAFGTTDKCTSKPPCCYLYSIPQTGTHCDCIVPPAGLSCDTMLQNHPSKPTKQTSCPP